jgi:hydrogenase maturation protease
MLTVIGLGNKLRGDDAIGPLIIENLAEFSHDYPIRLIDAGADAFAVLHYLVENNRVVLIDSARMNKEPGFVKRIELNNDSLVWADENISLHGYGFAEIFKIARELNPDVSCTLIAIEPKEISFNTSISDEVQKCVPGIIRMVIEESNKNVKEENFNN